MATPYLIGALNQFFFSRFTQRLGPFEIGSDVYACLADGSAATHYARMMKSTDGGQTWTEQDSANAPAIYKTVNTRFRIDVRQAGSDLNLAYIEPGGNASTIKFTAGAWGTADTGGPSIGAASGTKPQRLFRLLRSTGVSLFVYGKNTPDTYGVELNAGVWGTPFLISTLSLPTGGEIDASDRMTIFFDKTAPGDLVETIKCRTYTSASVLSGADIAVLDDGNISHAEFGLPSVFTVGGTEYVCLGYARSILFPLTTGAPIIAHAAFAIAPTADSPTFTLEQVNYLNPPLGSTTANDESCDFPTTIGADGKPHMAWLSAEGTLFSFFYDVRHAANLWEPANTIGYRTIEDSASPTRLYVQAIQGRYLSGRAKHAYLIDMQVDGGQHGIFYVEV